MVDSNNTSGTVGGRDKSLREASHAIDELEEMTLTMHNSKPRKNNAWLITFADLLSLMLTFFVLIYSMSTPVQHEWDIVVKSLQQRLNPDKDDQDIDFAADESVLKIKIEEAAELEYLYSIVKDKLQNAVGNKATLKYEGDRLIISLASDDIFELSSAKISKEGAELVHNVGMILSQLNNVIQVVGHTDPKEIDDMIFNSKWELSLARAAAVMRHINIAGYQHPIEVFGRGDSHYQKIIDSTPNIDSLSQEEKYRLARRIDIIIRSNMADF